MISLGSFLILVFACSADAATKTELFSQARQEYIQETSDYLETNKISLIEMRAWRGKRLNERFGSRLKRLEKFMFQSNKEITKEIETYVKKSGIDALDDVLLMRLAQLQYEKGSLLHAQKMKKYDARLKAFLRGRLKKPPVMPRPSYKRSIYYCKYLLKKFPDSALADKAHYLMAKNLEEMGYLRKAVKIYLRFLKRHPQSSLADEALWRMGEYYFDLDQYKKSIYFYQRLIKNRASQFRLKAIYKTGAAYMQIGKLRSAGKYFLVLMRETRRSDDYSPEIETLYGEALEYLAVVRDRGIRIKMPKEIAEEIVQRLAEMYKRVPNDKGARGVYRSYIASRNLSAVSPYFYDQIVSSYEYDNETKKAVASRDELVALLTANDVWWKRNREERQRYFEAEDLLEKHLLATARNNASKGLKARNVQLIALARKQYRKFLADYFYSPVALDAHFELAEIEYATGRYKTAAVNYRIVAQESKSEVQSEEAAYGYLWSQVKDAKYDMKEKGRLRVARDKEGNLKSAMPLAPQEQDFIKYANFYVEHAAVPSERKHRVLYKMAEIHFLKNDFEKAQKYLDQVIKDKENPNLTIAKALRLSAEIYNFQGSWENVRKRNQELLAMRSQSSVGNLKALGIASIGSQALEQASVLEKTGKKLEAAKEYEKAVYAAPRASYSNYAKWKAASLFREEKRFVKSNSLLDQIVKGDYLKESQFLRAANLESLLKFEVAAAAYTDFAKKNIRHEWAPQAWRAAGRIKFHLKQVDEAISCLEQYSRYEGGEFVRFEMLEKLADIGSVKKAKRVASYIPDKEPNRKLRINGLLAWAQWKGKKPRTAVKICHSVKSQYKKISNPTAQANRALAICDYIDFSQKLAKSSLRSRSDVEEAIKTILSHGHKDIAAKAWNDVGEKLILSGSGKANISWALDKAWSNTGRSVFDESSLRNLRLLEKANVGRRVFSGTLLDWRVTLPEAFSWKEFEIDKENWEQARVFCEMARTRDCFQKIDELLKNTENELALYNAVVASLLVGSDEDLIKYLSKFGKKTRWYPLAVQMAFVVGQSGLVPDAKKKIQSYPQEEVALRHIAEAEKANVEGDHRQAMASVQKAVLADSGYTHSYTVMARYMYALGYYELAAVILRQGVENTRAAGGLFGIRRAMKAMMQMSQGLPEKEELDSGIDARGLVGAGVASIVEEDQSAFNEVRKRLEEESIWSHQHTLGKILLSAEEIQHDGQRRLLLDLWAEVSKKGVRPNALTSMLQNWDWYNPELKLLARKGVYLK
jgi:tetratricopeptide (TPR) repeat protein